MVGELRAWSAIDGFPEGLKIVGMREREGEGVGFYRERKERVKEVA